MFCLAMSILSWLDNKWLSLIGIYASLLSSSACMPNAKGPRSREKRNPSTTDLAERQPNPLKFNRLSSEIDFKSRTVLISFLLNIFVARTQRGMSVVFWRNNHGGALSNRLKMLVK